MIRSRQRKMRALEKPLPLVLQRGRGWLLDHAMQELSGSVALAANIAVPGEGILASSVYPGSELLDESGASGTATAANWIANSGAILSNPSAGILRVDRVGGDFASQATQIILVVGKRYLVTGDFRNESGATATSTIGSTNFILGTETIWKSFVSEGVATDPTGTFLFVGGTGDGVYTEYKNLSVREANPLNGDYTAVTLGVAGGGGIPYFVTFNGATSKLVLTSAEYNSIYNPNQFSKSIWMESATWDTTKRYLFHDYIDANNYIAIYQTTTAGQLAYEMKAGGVQGQVLFTPSTLTGRHYLGISLESNVMKAWYNGVQVGGDQAVAGTSVGNFAYNVVGAGSATPTSVIIANLAYPTHNNVEKSAAEWLREYRAGR